jgi:hypothetical protein
LQLAVLTVHVRLLRVLEVLAAQVESITFAAGGPKAIGSNELAKKARFFAELDLEDLTPIRDAMSAAAPHIITKVDAVCPECGGAQTVQLPLGPGFFLPPDPSQETPEEEPEATTTQDDDQGEEKPTDGDTEQPSSAPSS